ncbi:hypothetical protein GCM10018963_15440 [Saccharothrix longispora]
MGQCANPGRMGKWGVLGAAVAVARAAVTVAVWRQVRRLPERGVRDGR